MCLLISRLIGTAVIVTILVMTSALSASAASAPVLNENGIVSTACYASCSGTGLAPGSIAAIFGTDLTDGSSCVRASGCNQTFDNQRRLRSTLAGAQVAINGVPVPIFYATPLTLGVQIPADVTGSTATVQVTVNGQTSNMQTLRLAPFSPGIFTANQQGTGAGAFSHADAAGTAIDAQHPAVPGETIILYMTGLGQTTPAAVTGALPAGAATTLAQPTVTVDGIPAQVQYSGLSGCCVGLNQLNIVIPASVRNNANVDVTVSIGGMRSNSVTLAVGAPAAPPQPDPTPAPPPAPAPAPAPAPVPPPPDDPPPYDPYY